MTIDQWLYQAANSLEQSGIDSHRLDAEVLLADVLERDRVHLHAHGEDTLTAEQLAVADTLLQRRRQRIPIAYILGHKEFYGRDFIVSPDVLIPRPETETLVELFLDVPLSDHASIVDIGTGSGAIAITLKLERPTLAVTATDISKPSLTIAGRNAARLGADIDFVQGNLLEPIHEPVDAIIANLPYVDPAWVRSPETEYEPSQALFAPKSGLALISQLIRQAAQLQASKSYMLLEADPRQHDQITTVAAAGRYSLLTIRDYALVFQK